MLFIILLLALLLTKEHSTQENDIKTGEGTLTSEKTANTDMSSALQTVVPNRHKVINDPDIPPPPPLSPTSGTISFPKKSEGKHNNPPASSGNNNQNNATAITPDGIKNAKAKLKKTDTKNKEEPNANNDNLNVAETLAKTISARRKQNNDSDESEEELSDHGWSDDEEQGKSNVNDTCYHISSTNPTQSQKAIVTPQGTNESQNPQAKETQQSGGKPIIPLKPESINRNTLHTLSVPPNNRGSNTSSQPLNDTNVSSVKKRIQQFEQNQIQH
ncbi:MAG: hypothetical protein U0X86_000607 [Wolbachia endosymbiont of Xenopsylla cheopis]